MTEVELAWLAGWLEGEGCFQWQKSTFSRNGRPKKQYRYPLIRVSCTDLDVVQKAAKIMDSSKPLKLKRYQPGKPLWMTNIGGKRALAIMGLILPHMGQRRSRKIQELFVLSATRPGTPRGEKAYQAKLTVDAVNEIRNSARKSDRGFQTDMAKKYGVSWGTIWYARKGLTWRDKPKESCQDTIATLTKPLSSVI